MLIVIEGIDGAGCETQAKLITQKLINQGNKAALIRYPHYDDPVGKMIKDFLYDNKHLTAEEQFLLYSFQFIHDALKIKELATNHQSPSTSYLIADRYFTTTLCYQTLEGIKMETALKFADDFKIEKPDLVFYLDVDPDTAIQRKSGEDKEKNRREKDFEFIKKTYAQYDRLIKDQVWAKWIRIDGNKTIDEITKDIYNKISNFK